MDKLAGSRRSSSFMDIGQFREQTLEMEDDYEGRVIATLIHSPENEGGRSAVLYLHGFNDYFFQAHVAEKFNENGYDFYALDLRKYGRSLLPHQHPNYCRDIKEYYEEIDRSLEIIQEETDKEIILLGHSTGGLIAASYLNDGTYRNQIDKLILNSPFLDFNVNFFSVMSYCPWRALHPRFFRMLPKRNPSPICMEPVFQAVSAGNGISIRTGNPSADSPLTSNGYMPSGKLKFICDINLIFHSLS